MLSWKKKQSGTDLRVSIEGQISEQTPLEPLTAELSGDVDGLAGKLIFDLAGVERINSIGCRQWLRMVHALSEKGVEIILERCSVPIVHQLSMIAGFEGNGRVRSVYAPYCCEECNREEDQLVSLERGVQEVLSQSVTCPECGGPMEFDDLPENYEGLAGILESRYLDTSSA